MILLSQELQLLLPNSVTEPAKSFFIDGIGNVQMKGHWAYNLSHKTLKGQNIVTH